jgi:hypothetical protein
LSQSLVRQFFTFFGFPAARPSIIPTKTRFLWPTFSRFGFNLLIAIPSNFRIGKHEIGRVGYAHHRFCVDCVSFVYCLLCQQRRMGLASSDKKENREIRKWTLIKRSTLTIGGSSLKLEPPYVYFRDRLETWSHDEFKTIKSRGSNPVIFFKNRNFGSEVVGR